VDGVLFRLTSRDLRYRLLVYLKADGPFKVFYVSLRWSRRSSAIYCCPLNSLELGIDTLKNPFSHFGFRFVACEWRPEKFRDG